MRSSSLHFPIPGPITCPIRLANIYVGMTRDDYKSDAALYCRINVTTSTLDPKYLLRCQQPVQGRYVTIQNYVYHKYDVLKHLYQERTCLNLCEVKIYAKGKKIKLYIIFAFNLYLH